jgi:AraC-like DNA-binding protein
MAFHDREIGAILKHNYEALSPEDADLNKLARLLDSYAPEEGIFPINNGELLVFRNDSVSDVATSMMSFPGVCIVAQGAKRCSLAHTEFEYDDTKMAVYAAECPISYKVTKASSEEPFLSLIIQIDPQKLSENILRVFPDGVPKVSDSKPIYISENHGNIVKTAVRLMEIITEQDDSDLLAPIAIDEILIRLLRSPSGPAIAQIGITDSNMQKIAKAITWIKNNYSESIRMEELAKIAGMSASSFHSHFKSLTNMTPLQYQKTLRLQEARNLMRTKMLDVSTASYEVGYASPSQFSREYSRHFGISPVKDMEQSLR